MIYRKLITTREAQAILGISSTTFERRRTPGQPGYDPTFPEPIRYSHTCIRWYEDEILAYRDERPRGKSMHGQRGA